MLKQNFPSKKMLPFYGIKFLIMEKFSILWNLNFLDSLMENVLHDGSIIAKK